MRKEKKREIILEGSWNKMISKLNLKQCTGCEACSSVCPKSCISMQPDAEGFYYPIVNDKDCINCGLCVKACPICGLKTEECNLMPKAVLAYANNANILNQATSGGVFSAVAYDFIKDGGYVCAAFYEDDFRVVHKVFNDSKMVKDSARSKYVQSRIQGEYQSIKRILKNGKRVLFCGTACQVYGLKSYLRTLDVKIDGLYTMDIVCHGVPSYKLMDSYLSYLTAWGGVKPDSIKMREKRRKLSWYDAEMTVFFDSVKYSNSSASDPYLRCFLGNVAMRESCYDCPFKTIGRISDLTIGDCWFSRSLTASEDVPFDVTLGLIQSNKGKEMIETCEGLEHVSVDTEKAIKCNGGMIYSSPPRHDVRKSFYMQLDKVGIKDMADELFPFEENSKCHMPFSSIKNIIKHFPSVYEKYYYAQRDKEFRNRIQRIIPKEAFSRRII